MTRRWWRIRQPHLRQEEEWTESATKLTEAFSRVERMQVKINCKIKSLSTVKKEEEEVSLILITDYIFLGRLMIHNRHQYCLSRNRWLRVLFYLGIHVGIPTLHSFRDDFGLTMIQTFCLIGTWQNELEKYFLFCELNSLSKMSRRCRWIRGNWFVKKSCLYTLQQHTKVFFACSFKNQI